MGVEVSVEVVKPRKLAAVWCQVPVRRDLGAAVHFGPLWTFLRSQLGLHTDGHNIFLCHRNDAPERRTLVPESPYFH
jgi:hypothetical protein